MKLTAILAIGQNGELGLAGGMPWPRLARDMRRFRDATAGKACILGRRTYDDLPPLPNRRLFVLTRQCSDIGQQRGWGGDPRCKVVAIASLSDALAKCTAESEVMVIGGAEVYRATLPSCDRLLLTVVHSTFPADTFLDPPERLTEGWVRLTSETHDPDEANPCRVTFSEWVRP